MSRDKNMKSDDVNIRSHNQNQNKVMHNIPQNMEHDGLIGIKINLNLLIIC